jgi:hypothetical protein
MDKQVEQAIKKIIEGCRGIKDDQAVHPQAKELATLIIKDLNSILEGATSNV